MSGYFGNCAERKIVSAGFRLQFLRNIDSFHRQLLVAAPYFIAPTLDISYLTAKGGGSIVWWRGGFIFNLCEIAARGHKNFSLLLRKSGKVEHDWFETLVQATHIYVVDPSKSWQCIHPSHVTAGLRHQCISRKNPNTPIFQPRASGEDILCFVFLLKKSSRSCMFFGEKTQYAVLWEFQHLWPGGNTFLLV